MHKPRVIRDDVIKIARVLKGPDNRVARTLENPNHATFAPSASIFRPLWQKIAINPRNHAVAMHRRAHIFRGDKNVRLARSFGCEETVAGLMDRQFAGDK